MAWFFGAAVGFVLTMVLLATITYLVFKGVGIFGGSAGGFASGAALPVMRPEFVTIAGTSNEFCVPLPNGVPVFAVKRTEASEPVGPKFVPVIVKAVERAENSVPPVGANAVSVGAV